MTELISEDEIDAVRKLSGEIRRAVTMVRSLTGWNDAEFARHAVIRLRCFRMARWGRMNSPACASATNNSGNRIKPA